MNTETPRQHGTSFLRRRITWIVLLSSLALVALGFWGFQRGSSEKGNDAVKKEAVPATLEFGAADIAVVTIQPLARTVSVSGSLLPQTQAIVKATVPGEVRRLLVREGDTVRQGAVVAEIDTSEARARLEAALADQAERRSRQAIAARNRDTNLALLQQNFISQNAFDQLRSTYEGSEAAVQWADAQVKLVRKSIDDAVVRAPISGQVAKRMANEGERVSPDGALLSIVDLSRMELEVTVPASDVASIATDQVVRFRVDGYADRPFEGRVARINPVTEIGSRAIKVFIAVPNPDRSLRGGMFAQGLITLSTTSQRPVVPMAAVIEEAGQSYVFTVEEGKLAKRAIALGLRDEATGMVVVDNGLHEGVAVVRIRMNGLKAGAPAVVRAAAPKANASSPA